MSTMTAVRWHGRDDVRVDTVPRPRAPGPGEVTIDVRWCGLCGTDLEEWRHGPLFIPIEPNPVSGDAAPLTLGHEFAGEVVAVGEGVELAVGERVGCETLITCGHCRYCRAGDGNRCESLAAVGLMAHGGLAETCTVPAATCLPLPAGVSYEAGALCETLSVAVRALGRGRLAPGESVLVTGGGAVGLMAAQAAAALGAERVAVAEPLDRRRDLARELGAEPLDPGEVPAEAYDVVVECSGATPALHGALRAARRGGRVVIVGLHDARTPVEVGELGIERELTTSFSHQLIPDYATALELLASGRVRAEPLVSHRIQLAAAVQDGLAALEADPAAHLKVLVDCSRP
jgi:(R,R)-butanediol dehydrogenase/meso-butanediol dehydrogenase/diacetyl reductase